MESFGPSPAWIEMRSESEILRPWCPDSAMRSRGRTFQRARHMKFIWLLWTSSCQRSNQTFHGGILVGCFGCVVAVAQKVKACQGDVLVSKIANDLTTPTIHPKQATQIAKTWALKNMVELLEFEDSLAIKQENWKLYLSHKAILPRKHSCKQVAATNFQPPRDRRHLSYSHCENLQGMQSAKFLAHVHHSGANIALWPRSPPSLQWQVHESTSESWVTKYGTHWHSSTVLKLTKKQKSRNQENDWIHLQTPLHHPF